MRSSLSLLERDLGHDHIALTYLTAANRALDEAVEIIRGGGRDRTA